MPEIEFFTERLGEETAKSRHGWPDRRIVRCGTNEPFVPTGAFVASVCGGALHDPPHTPCWGVWAGFCRPRPQL